jgi:OOP family OmpA-OmpF porin
LIEAHTDDRGSENYNLIVSQKWSGLVRGYFLDEEQLTDIRFRPIGYGESRPRFPNISEKARRENRRIEILIIR